MNRSIKRNNFQNDKYHGHGIGPVNPTLSEALRAMIRRTDSRLEVLEQIAQPQATLAQAVAPSLVLATDEMLWAVDELRKNPCYKNAMLERFYQSGASRHQDLSSTPLFPSILHSRSPMAPTPNHWLPSQRPGAVTSPRPRAPIDPKFLRHRPFVPTPAQPRASLDVRKPHANTAYHRGGSHARQNETYASAASREILDAGLRAQEVYTTFLKYKDVKHQSPNQHLHQASRKHRARAGWTYANLDQAYVNGGAQMNYGSSKRKETPISYSPRGYRTSKKARVANGASYAMHDLHMKSESSDAEEEWLPSTIPDIVNPVEGLPELLPDEEPISDLESSSDEEGNDPESNEFWESVHNAVDAKSGPIDWTPNQIHDMVEERSNFLRLTYLRRVDSMCDPKLESEVSSRMEYMAMAQSDSDSDRSKRHGKHYSFPTCVYNDWITFNSDVRAFALKNGRNSLSIFVKQNRTDWTALERIDIRALWTPGHEALLYEAGEPIHGTNESRALERKLSSKYDEHQARLFGNLQWSMRKIPEYKLFIESHYEALLPEQKIHLSGTDLLSALSNRFKRDTTLENQKNLARFLAMKMLPDQTATKFINILEEAAKRLFDGGYRPNDHNILTRNQALAGLNKNPSYNALATAIQLQIDGIGMANGVAVPLTWEQLKTQVYSRDIDMGNKATIYDPRRIRDNKARQSRFKTASSVTKPTVTCTFCGKPGHYSSQCRKREKPQGHAKKFDEKKKSSYRPRAKFPKPSGGKSFKCYNCGSPDHPQNKCPLLQGDNRRGDQAKSLIPDGYFESTSYSGGASQPEIDADFCGVCNTASVSPNRGTSKDNYEDKSVASYNSDSDSDIPDLIDDDCESETSDNSSGLDLDADKDSHKCITADGLRSDIDKLNDNIHSIMSNEALRLEQSYIKEFEETGQSFNHCSWAIIRDPLLTGKINVVLIEGLAHDLKSTTGIQFIECGKLSPYTQRAILLLKREAAWMEAGIDTYNLPVNLKYWVDTLCPRSFKRLHTCNCPVPGELKSCPFMGCDSCTAYSELSVPNFDFNGVNSDNYHECIEKALHTAASIAAALSETSDSEEDSMCMCQDSDSEGDDEGPAPPAHLVTPIVHVAPTDWPRSLFSASEAAYLHGRMLGPVYSLTESADGSMVFYYISYFRTPMEYRVAGTATQSERADFALLVFETIHPHVEVLATIWIPRNSNSESTTTVERLGEDNRVAILVRLREGQDAPPATPAYLIEDIDHGPTGARARLIDSWRARSIQSLQSSVAQSPEGPIESGKAEDDEVAGIQAAAEAERTSNDWLRRQSSSRHRDDSSSSSYPSYGSGVIRPTAREGSCVNLTCKYCSKPLNTEYCRKWHVKCRQEALEAAADGKTF